MEFSTLPCVFKVFRYKCAETQWFLHILSLRASKMLPMRVKNEAKNVFREGPGAKKQYVKNSNSKLNSKVSTARGPKKHILKIQI